MSDIKYGMIMCLSGILIGFGIGLGIGFGIG